MGLAPLGLAVVHNHSGPVGHIDPDLGLADHNLGLGLVDRNLGLGLADRSLGLDPAGRTAVADRIETFFWKVEIEGSSDEPKNFLR